MAAELMRDPSENVWKFERKFVRPRAGRTLITGSRVYETNTDRRPLYRDVLGVDLFPGPGVDRVVDLEQPLPADLGLFDHVECLSVLEHSPRPWLIAANIERLMNPRATLHVTVPWAWSLHAYPGDFFRISREGLQALFPSIKWHALRYAHERLEDGGKTPRKRVDGYIYVAMTTTCGFGVRQ